MNRSPSARHADPRSAAAALLSFVFPGAGQAYNGRWALAWLLATPVLLIVILAVLVLASGSSVVGRLLDTRVLVTLIVLDVALLGWRLLAILEAHVDRAILSLRSWPAWVTLFLVIVTIAMHALPGYYAAKAIDTLDSVALEGGGGGLFNEREGPDVELAEPTFEPEVRRGERVTVLLVGVDFAPGRDHHLTDTMLVATLDPKTGESAMVSVPRDLYGVPLDDGRTWNAKLNSLMSQAGGDPTSFPQGGPAALKAAIGELLGTRIHYFAAIDIEGMRQVIDTIGGVNITVERAVNDPHYIDTFTGDQGFFLEPGLHHMDGRTAMAFIRSRQGEGDNDFIRAERQQQVLTAIGEKLRAGNLLVTLPGLLDAIKDNVSTDIPSSRFPDLAAEAQRANLGDIERIVLTPPEYVTPDPNSAAGYILIPKFEAISELGERIFGQSTAEAPSPEP